MKLKVHCLIIAILGISMLGVAETGKENPKSQLVPTQADAAVIFAKYSGLFDRYITADATVSECVSFLNKEGIYFGLMEVVDGATFKLHDCARVMGQMTLIFSGEAEYVAGKVRLPRGIDSWEQFCILNNVKYVQGYENLVNTLGVLHHLAR